jgi:hypothetical protein
VDMLHSHLVYRVHKQNHLDTSFAMSTVERMTRRGHSTTIGKFAKIARDRQRSEIRILGEALRREQITQDEQPAKQA